MRIKSPSTANGINLEQRPNTATGDKNHWEEIPTVSNYFYIKNKNTDRFIYADASTGVLQQQPTWTGQRSQWRYENVMASRSSTAKEETNIFLYPNPAESLLTIRGVSAGTYNTIIYSLEGKLLKNSYITINNNSVELDVSELKQGMYILIIKNESVNNFFRFLKQ